MTDLTLIHILWSAVLFLAGFEAHAQWAVFIAWWKATREAGE